MSSVDIVCENTKASDEEILNALVGQYDLDFGYRALVKEKPEIFWIGEKTGQNSLVIGSTVAFKIGEERYVMLFDREPKTDLFWSLTIYDPDTRVLLDNRGLAKDVGKQGR